MARAKRARKAETPTQPSFCLWLRAPHFYPTTIEKYICRVREPGEPGGQTWSTFLVKHGNRQVVHLNVTRSPSDAWADRQLREATPFGEAPRYLIRDNDCKYGPQLAAVGTGIEIVNIQPRSPDYNAIVERFLRSARNECLDDIVILGEGPARRVLREYAFDYFNKARPHQGIGQEIPKHLDAGIEPNPEGGVIARPTLGGLNHDYRRTA